MRLCALCLAIFGLAAACPAVRAEAPHPNRVAVADGPPGPVATLVMAARLFALAQTHDDPLLALGALNLSQGLRFRTATGWTMTTEDTAKAAAPIDAADLAPTAILSPETLASGQVGALVRLMAEGDVDLRALLDDVETASPRRFAGSAVQAPARVAAGTTDVWRIPFFGNAPAEVGLISTGPARLDLTVLDAAGLPICQGSAPSALGLCRFTPALNGYFTVQISNPAGPDSAYILLSN